MKQCVACGRRYSDSDMVCPKCYSPDWAEPQNIVSTHIASTSFVCRHCITLVEGGTARCPNCGKSVAPGLLTIFCMIGLAGAPIVLGYILYSFFIEKNPDAIWLSPDGVLCIAAFPIIYGLMQAKRWGWYTGRVLLIASLLVVGAMVILADRMGMSEMSANLAGMLVMRFVGLLPLWIYLDSRDLREYCGIVFNA